MPKCRYKPGYMPEIRCRKCDRILTAHRSREQGICGSCFAELKREYGRIAAYI